MLLNRNIFYITKRRVLTSKTKKRLIQIKQPKNLLTSYGAINIQRLFAETYH